MKGTLKLNSAAAALLCLLPLCAGAGSYPGAFWTQTGRDMSGIDGTYTQGMVRQGVELARPGGLPLQAYGRYNWRLRGINKDYYNSYTPYLGAMISSNYIDAGLEFGRPRYTGLAMGDTDHSVFVNWFRYWSLKEWKETDAVKALPLSTWGGAAYDLSGRNGSSTLGWVKLEAHTFRLPLGWMAGPFVALDWRLRTHNADYFDYSAVSGGLMAGGRHVQVGLKHSWRDYPRLNRGDKGFEIFLSIYRPWDLGGRSAD